MNELINIAVQPQSDTTATQSASGRPDQLVPENGFAAMLGQLVQGLPLSNVVQNVVSNIDCAPLTNSTICAAEVPTSGAVPIAPNLIAQQIPNLIAQPRTAAEASVANALTGQSNIALQLLQLNDSQLTFDQLATLLNQLSNPGANMQAGNASLNAILTDGKSNAGQSYTLPAELTANYSDLAQLQAALKELLSTDSTGTSLKSDGIDSRVSLVGDSKTVLLDLAKTLKIQFPSLQLGKLLGKIEVQVSQPTQFSDKDILETVGLTSDSAKSALAELVTDAKAASLPTQLVNGAKTLLEGLSKPVA